jgi:hypothetical protein
VSGFAVASQLIADQPVDESIPEKVVVKSGQMQRICRTLSRGLSQVNGRRIASVDDKRQEVGESVRRGWSRQL